jgi:exo-beta-1,3-glucanase (GH17 family)
MPGERATQITVNASVPLDLKDPTKGTAIKYTFNFKKPDDWMGVYSLLDGGAAWGTKAGINVQKLLDVGPETKLALRFRAKGEGVVEFKCGGVAPPGAKFPSSLRFPVELRPSPTTLTKEFVEYTIGPIEARQMVNLIDPLCITTTILDNRGREAVQAVVDDIRIEAFDRALAPAPPLPAGWRDRLMHTCWVCYTPTGFDPTVKPVKKPTATDIRADLAAIRALADKVGIKGDRMGIITYGCRDGLEEIAAFAKDADLSLILGIFNPTDEVEVRNAEAILKRDDLGRTIAACCVGNEAITFRRATLDDIRRVAEKLRRVRAVPCTTTEIIQAMGKEELSKSPFSYALTNAHAIFADVSDCVRGAKWATERLKDLVESAPKDHPILAKELGWPAGPAPFDAKQQAAYWKAVFADPIAKKVNVCIFDSFKNVPWKNEPVAVSDGGKVNVGPHWPVLFDDKRKPTPFAEELLELWKKSREP